MEKITIPYNYINLMAFANLLKFGNRDSIDINDLNNYRNKYINNIISFRKVCKNKKTTYDKIDDETINSDFLYNYDGLFSEEDGIIYINEGIGWTDILTEAMNVRATDEGCEDAYLVGCDSIDMLKIIKATYINDFYNKLLKYEIEFETAYLNYFNNKTPENKKELDKYMAIKYVLLSKIKSLPDYRIEALRSTSLESETEKDEDFEYDIFPFDKEIWDSVQHVENLDSDELAYDLNQYSIFSEYPIYYKKLTDEIETIYLSSVNDIFSFFTELSENKKGLDFTKLLFYLKYVDNINKYLEKNNDMGLLESKIRVLYSIDKPELCLYDENNLKKEIEYVNSLRVDQKEYYIDKDEVIFLIGELFINDDDFYTAQKLLLIKTYYDLTQNEEIRDFFDDFKPLKKYDLYKNIVFGKEKTKKI